ncbi:ribonuclease P [Malassezia sp. CBS 17886]|nr:ribonuclease P [Malassezia sp. CBS 17886]
MSSPDGCADAASDVFCAVLSAAPGISGADAHAHYDARVHGRRVQLANVDRAPPTRDAVLQRRRERALQRARARARPRARMRAAPSVRGAAPHLRSDARASLPEITYAETGPLQTLWVSYMHDLLDLGAAVRDTGAIPVRNAAWVQTMQNTVSKADWTGACISVVRSTNPAVVHERGVVLEETHETFVLWPLPTVRGTPMSSAGVRAKMVPKQNTVFRLEIPLVAPAAAPAHTVSSAVPRTLTVDLHGNQIRYTLSVRATRKHKARKTVELG